jgi:glycosyltransferase involved in cell wall biosynthesis
VRPGGGRRRIVVATCDALTPKMAGPAIRARQIAAALSAEHDVQLVTTSVSSITDPGFPVRAVDDRELADLERWCDVLVFQGWLVTGRPFLLGSDKVLVADAYDPLHLEQLEQGRDGGDEVRRRAVRNATEVLNEQLMRADLVLCASTRQRDFWLGQLAAVGRVNPRTYDDDPTMASLITVVPFGIPETPPARTRPAVKGVVPGIAPDDELLLWGGGVYNWFDPLTLVRAVDRVRHRQPRARLLFMGLRHPNPDIPEMRMAAATRALADELGLTGTHVFFNEDWVPYDDRHNYLLEADVGVTTHLAHLETALSSRTRILDYLWASLPVVATEGDVLSDLVAARGLGLTVPPGDVDALEQALMRMLDDDGFRKTCANAIATVAPELAWSRALAPLVEFCRHPRRAPDLVDPLTAGRLRRELGPPARGAGWLRDVRIGIEHLRDGGPALLASKAWDRARRRLG